MTEEEQIEAIKKWWMRYSTIITIVLSVIMLSVSGYKYWQWHVNKVATKASNAYEHLMVAFSNHDERGISAYANQLISVYGKTVYADAARMAMAKVYAEKESFDKAKNMLNYVANHSSANALKQVARLRIARILFAQKKYDQALGELKSVDATIYNPVINELKGDILAATGKYEQAIIAYKEAINDVKTQGLANLYLEMKTNELAALAQSVTVGAGTNNLQSA